MRRSGYTLTEVILTVTVLGILLGLAAPKLSGMVARERTRSALNRFTADFHLARMSAVRSVASVEVRLTNSGACTTPARTVAADGWTILVPSTGRVIRRTLPGELKGVCLRSNSDATILVNSRGLLAPFENRTLTASGSDFADTLTLNVMGRVYRRY
jgi:prepilin-type N-terminal cleavage/methylation domain-containing protein